MAPANCFCSNFSSLAAVTAFPKVKGYMKGVFQNIEPAAYEGDIVTPSHASRQCQVF
jgi:hypothetical protein